MDTSNVTGQLSPLVALVRVGVMLISMVTFANSARAETFSAPGAWTYTVPSGVNAVEVLVAGGGGGGADGGNSNPAIAPEGAGGNGARITAIISVAPGQVLSGTIGAGGATGFFAGARGIGGGGGGGGTTFAVNGTVLLQAAGGGGASASAGITSTTLSSSSLCGIAATGFSSANFLPDGGSNCHNGSTAIKSMAVSADGGAGASGVSALATTAGPAGGSGYVSISTSAIAITTSSTTIEDLVSAANPKSVPGATMEHCFLMSNAWSTNVDGVTISVQIAPNQAYIDGSAKAGTTCDAATTPAGVTHNAGTLTLNAASISANASYALVYRSNIN